MIAFPSYTWNSNTKNMHRDTTTIHMYKMSLPRGLQRSYFSIVFRICRLARADERFSCLDKLGETPCLEKLRDMLLITQWVTPGSRAWPSWSLLILFSNQCKALGSVSPSRVPCFSARAANFSFLDEQWTFQGYQNKQWKEHWPSSQNEI